MTKDQIINNYLEFFIPSLKKERSIIWDHYLTNGVNNIYVSYDIRIIGNKKIIAYFHIDDCFFSHLRSIFSFMEESEEYYSKDYFRKKISSYLKLYNVS